MCRLYLRQRGVQLLEVPLAAFALPTSSLIAFLPSNSPWVGSSSTSEELPPNQRCCWGPTPAHSKPKTEETNFKLCLHTAQGQTCPAFPTAGPAPNILQVSTNKAGIFPPGSLIALWQPFKLSWPHRRYNETRAAPTKAKIKTTPPSRTVSTPSRQNCTRFWKQGKHAVQW